MVDGCMYRFDLHQFYMLCIQNFTLILRKKIVKDWLNQLLIMRFMKKLGWANMDFKINFKSLCKNCLKYLIHFSKKGKLR
jgi:hypothetical protein